MKRTLLLVLSLLLGISFPHAQDYPGGRYKHVIDVEAYPDWGQGYLTVADPHYYYIDDERHAETFEPISSETAYFPNLADIIISVTDKSALNMTPNEFYAIVDKSDEFKLTLENRKGEQFAQRYIVKRELDSVWKNYIRTGLGGSTGSAAKYQSNEVADRNIDFRKMRKYDYLIVGDDPLNDTKILDQIPKWFGMIRDTKNPDIIFTIAKNADEKISSTYIPPTSRTVNTGSTTKSHYNYLTKRYDFVTKQQNQTIHEGGYTETTKTADIFFELAALDAKRINDKSISYAPIVWQFTATRYVVNPSQNFSMMDEYKAYASRTSFPPYDRYRSSSYILFEKSGLVADEEKWNVVGDVLPGSRAEAAGFQKGDVIKKAEFSYRGAYFDTYEQKWKLGSSETLKWKNAAIVWFDEERDVLNNTGTIEGAAQFWCHDVKVTVKRNGKTVELTLKPRYKTVNFYRLGFAEFLK